jgi:kynureninase
MHQTRGGGERRRSPGRRASDQWARDALVSVMQMKAQLTELEARLLDHLDPLIESSDADGALATIARLDRSGSASPLVAELPRPDPAR